MIKLYSYFRSSASYRVRIALNHKGLPYEYIPVHLIKDGGQQKQESFLKINPMGHVPALDHDGFLVTESMAIFDYLDLVFPSVRLFPTESHARAKVISLCETINSGIQPLQNLKVFAALKSDFGQTDEDVSRWAKHWIGDGMAKLEKMLEKTASTYSFGGTVSAVDCFLIPQCFASKRLGVDPVQFPTIARINENCLKLPAFQAAHPEKQPDYAP
jgi:maleylacetoacetate isomerase